MANKFSIEDVVNVKLQGQEFLGTINAVYGSDDFGVVDRIGLTWFCKSLDMDLIFTANQHPVSAPKYKVGDLVKYVGPSQAGILAPGDLVEVKDYTASGMYKLAIPFNPHYTFYAPQYHLETLHSGTPAAPKKQLAIYDYADMDASLPTSYPISSQADQQVQWKLEGRCEKCGTLRKVTAFGLSDCAPCSSELWR